MSYKKGALNLASMNNKTLMEETLMININRMKRIHRTLKINAVNSCILNKRLNSVCIFVNKMIILV